MSGLRSFSYSSQGASHKKRNVVCQDASFSEVLNGGAALVIVADGHGSPQYFRSDAGSRLAVEAAANRIREFIAGACEPVISEDVLQKLAKDIIETWRSDVVEHERQNPFADDLRMESIDKKYRLKYLNDTQRRYIYHAYGTTLIAAVVAENFWFGFQIGDGKFVALFDDGSWEQPIPWDDRCFLNMTTSLCDADAISEFRYWRGPADGDSRKPVALFAGSDGVDDTYPVFENEKYLKFLYRTVVLSFVKEGFDKTSEQLKTLIDKLADQGSQDDVSIACVVGDMAPALVDALAGTEN